MIKLYFKQAFYLLRENKLLSSISIIGTALAIAMIMVIVITLRATIAPFAPESHRDRMLIFRYAGLQNKSNINWQSNGPIAYNTAKACFKEMTVPEAVSITSAFQETMLAAKPAGEMESCSVLQTDDAFWKVFEFDFVSGKPYDNADFDAGAAKAVISEDMARRLFGTSEVVGKTFLLNHTAYLISGVVRSVSRLARYAYAQVWIPLSSTDAFTTAWGDEKIMGIVAVFILAKSKEDFPAIHNEADRLKAVFMAGHPNFDLLYRGQPDTYFVAAQRYSANNPPAVKEAVRQYILTLLVLLIVPAVNLSGLTLSRMRKRLSEIGVRKAFGAPRRELMIQVLSENMLYSLFGGILGLILSYIATFLLGGMLFSVDFMSNGVEDLQTMCVDLLFDPTVFLLAFLACFLLNLLSAAIPAWRITRTNVADAINER
ncbi:ABC transporter permease [Bacteroides ovatus]|uniref:ABC transporter permease n=1 Tax=Bacteroides ovatus TaxID=28116 RepID=UPI000ED30654|nr:ABC transporter permease [Bacteroides ovatus]HCJ26198.1 ABC transporter permease [Bacteroides ovatus]